MSRNPNVTALIARLDAALAKQKKPPAQPKPLTDAELLAAIPRLPW